MGSRINLQSLLRHLTEDLMTGISLRLSWGNWSSFYKFSPDVRQGAILRLFESL